MGGNREASSPTIMALREQVKRLNACAESIAVAMANGRFTDDKARDELGPEYELLRRKADAIMQEHAEAVRRDREIKERIREREMEHEVRVP
jgi:hypothetical protein